MQRESRLEAERVVLVPITQRIARRVLTGRQDGLPCSPGWPTEETHGVLAIVLERGRSAPPGWLIVRRTDRSIIGDCGWHDWPDALGTIEIGYGLASPVWGKGYGTEAVATMLNWTFRHPGVRRVTARVLRGNEASVRLLRRAGFVETATDQFTCEAATRGATPPDRAADRRP